MDHQAVGRDQQNLEENEEVEEVAGQERAHNPHELKLEKRMKMPPPLVPAGTDRKEQHEERQHRRQKDHHRRQPVPDHDDTKGRGPVAQTIEEDRAIGRLPGQASSDRDQRRDACNRENPLNANVVACGQHDERREDRGQDDGHDDPMGHVASSATGSGSGSPGGI